MGKAIAFSAIVLVVSATAFGAAGDIWQGFMHSANIGGQFSWSTGEGGGGFETNTTVHNDQTAAGVFSNAFQSADITLAVEGGGGGDGATIKAEVDANSVGTDGADPFGPAWYAGQVQSIGSNVSPMAQAQGAKFGEMDELSRKLGPGGTEGEATIDATMFQDASNNSGMLNQTAMVTASQEGEVGGGPDGVGSVATQANVTTSQIQSLN